MLLFAAKFNVVIPCTSIMAMAKAYSLFSWRNKTKVMAFSRSAELAFWKILRLGLFNCKRNVYLTVVN